MPEHRFTTHSQENEEEKKICENKLKQYVQVINIKVITKRFKLNMNHKAHDL